MFALERAPLEDQFGGKRGGCSNTLHNVAAVGTEIAKRHPDLKPHSRDVPEGAEIHETDQRVTTLTMSITTTAAEHLSDEAIKLGEAIQHLSLAWLERVTGVAEFGDERVPHAGRSPNQVARRRTGRWLPTEPTCLQCCEHAAELALEILPDPVRARALTHLDHCTTCLSRRDVDDLRPRGAVIPYSGIPGPLLWLFV
jgi:hypothetical protein